MPLQMPSARRAQGISEALLPFRLSCPESEGFVEASFSVEINDKSMSLVSQLYNHAHVQEVNYEGTLVKVVFKAVPWFADRVKGRVEKLGGTFTREVNSKEGSNVARSCCSEMGTQA